MENRAQIQKNTFFYNIKRVHFVGIGGISLSALALLSSRLGIVVTGSNNDKNAQLLALSKAGICVYLGHSADNVPKDCDMLVYSGAVPSNNPEVERARDMRIPVVERSVYLAEISRLYDNVIAIAGSHGKTSTTALIGHIFTIAGLNPTIHIGGNAVGYGNLRIGSTKYFITEACEYRNSMQYLTPNTAVVTNVDNDHLDYYKTFRNVIKAFQGFANTASDNLVVGGERFFRKKERGARLISAGLDAKQTVYAANIIRTKKGSKFDLVVKGKNVGSFELHQWGKHNIKNAVYAIAVSLEYGIGVNIIRKALKSYKGVERRYEKIGKYRGVTLISDYAHHPCEIKNSICGLKSHFENIVVVFQPHTYSRTRLLIEEFKHCFKGANHVIIYPTYPARESYDTLGDEKTLFANISNKNKYLVANTFDLNDMIDTLVSAYDIDAICYMGAGDLPLIVKDKG